MTELNRAARRRLTRDTVPIIGSNPTPVLTEFSRMIVRYCAAASSRSERDFLSDFCNEQLRFVAMRLLAMQNLFAHLAHDVSRGPISLQPEGFA